MRSTDADSHRDAATTDARAARGAPYRVVFFGTPPYAVPTLEALANDPLFDVRLAVTQPDRAAGRKRELIPPAVKHAAEKLALPVYQPESLKTQAWRLPIMETDPDLFVVAAYGLLFGGRTLAIPRFGSVNLHASLLPLYRGASPVSAAILGGDSETGVTLMKMEQGLDAGPIVGAKTIPIAPDDTTQSLTEKLGYLAAEVASALIPAYVHGTRPLVPQTGPYSVVRQLTKADGWIDWNLSSEHLERHIRAMWAWPRAWTTLDGAVVQIHQARAAGEQLNLEPGSISILKSGVHAACQRGSLVLERVQPSGRGAMEALAWANGLRQKGLRFDSTARPDLPSPLIRHVA